MDIQNLLNNPDGQNLTVNIPLLNIIQLQILCENNILLNSIFRHQILLEELVKGKVKTEADEAADIRWEKLSKEIAKLSNESYLSLVNRVVE